MIPKTGVKDDIFRPIYLKENVQTTTTESSFVLKKFSNLLKTAVQEDYMGGVEEKLVCNSFLDSSISRLAHLPNLDNQSDFFKCLLICLRKEENSNLRMEAVKLIIMVNAESTLGRWDAMIFKQVTKDILNSGTNDQKQEVALYYVKNHIVNHQVIYQLRKGLGSFDKNTQKETVEILGTLDLEFVQVIVDICAEDSCHSNWRIRFDVVSLLNCWIPRLAPPEQQVPPPRDPDALATDDETTMKALFFTLGHISTPLEHSEELGEEPTSSDQPQRYVEKKASEHLYTNEYFKCVEIMLKLLTSDWSEHVRCAASDAIGYLSLGKTMFQWIISTLSSNDPVKRIDALRCLSCIGIIHAESLPYFIKCFKDPYSSVRIEACRVAQALACSDKQIISGLMDLLDDHEYRVRAYSIKGNFSHSL